MEKKPSRQIKFLIAAAILLFVTSMAVAVFADSSVTYSGTIYSGSVSTGASLEDAADILRETLESYEDSCTIDFGTNDISEDIEISSSDYSNYKIYNGGEAFESEDELRGVKLAIMVLWEACEHTGEPDEGDYMFFNIASMGFSYTQDEDGGWVLSYGDITYLSDAEDTEEVLAYAKTETSSVSGKSDYEKVKFVYDLLCTYSFTRSDSSGNMSSAYGMLENECGTSQGFAHLGYYLLNHLGVEARIVTRNSGAAAFLIVQLDGAWYYFDPAYAVRTGLSGDDIYEYFLKGTSSMGSSWSLDWQYDFSMSSSDYEVSDVTFESDSVIVKKGTVYTNPASDAAGRTLTYVSSDESVAIVDQNGTITGVSVGEAVITAYVEGETAEGSSAECSVSVVTAKTLTVISGIDGSVLTSGEYILGDEVSISAPDADGYSFISWEGISEEWLSDDEMSLSDAEITFIMPDEDVAATAVYEKIEIEGLTLSDESISLAPGETYEISYALSPEDALDDITFSSEDETVATVDENGLITAVEEGLTRVYLSSDGSVIAEIEVTVETRIFTVTVTARSTSNGEYAESSAEAEYGSEVTVSVGDVSSYGYLFDGWESDPEDIDAYEAEDEIIFTMPKEDVSLTVLYSEVEPEDFTLSATSVTVSVGGTYQIEVALSPSNAIADITYASKDTSVAYVDEYGLITGVSEGTTTVYVSTGGIRKAVKVTVDTGDSTSSEYVSISESSISIYEGDTYTLTVTKRNAGTLTWTTSDDDVATVSSSGKVTGVEAGTATITATGEGGTYDTVKVTVKEEDDDDDDDGDDDEDDDDEDDEDETDADSSLAWAAAYKTLADSVRAESLASSAFVSGSASSSGTVYNTSYGTSSYTATVLESAYASGSAEEGFTATVGGVSFGIAGEEALSNVYSILIEEIERNYAVEEGYTILKLYEITMYDADGNEVEPSGNVSVCLAGDSVEAYLAAYDIDILHIYESEQEADVVDIQKTENSITFTTDSFSQYAIATQDEVAEDVLVSSGYGSAVSSPTGDSSKMGLWIVLAAAGAVIIVIAAVIVIRRRRGGKPEGPDDGTGDEAPDAVDESEGAADENAESESTQADGSGAAGSESIESAGEKPEA